MSKEGKKAPEKKSIYGFLSSALNNKMDKVVNNKVDKGSNSNTQKESKPSTSFAKDKNEFNNNSKDKEKKNEISKSNDDKMSKDPNLPDRSYGDYFCPTCDSHMNSENMWTAHIIGKRHLKNIRKDDPDLKYNDLEVESTGIKEALRRVRDPIVGLSYIHEIRRREPNVPPIYNCFLCHASLSTIELVIQHAISYKHRLNYIKENNPKEHILIERTGLNKVQKSSLVEEACQKLEAEKGRGSVKVKQEKPKRIDGFYKRTYSSDDSDYDDPKPPKSQRRDDTNPYLWKSIDSGKNRGSTGFKDLREKISHRSDDDEYRRSPPRRKDSPQRIFKREDDFYHPKKHGSMQKNANYEPLGPRIQKPVIEKEEYYPRPEEQFHPLSRTRSIRSRSPVKHSLPHEIAQSSTTSTSDSFSLKQFVQHMFALPADVFLKIALSRMETMDLKGIDELSLLSQLIQKSQKLLCKKLPPDVQNVLKQKMSVNTEMPVQRMTPPEISVPRIPQTEKPSTSQEKQTDFSFIKDLLNSVKMVSSASTESSNQRLNYQDQGATLYQNQSTNSYQPPAGMSQMEISLNALSAYSFQSQAQNNYSSAQSNFATIPGLNLAQNPSNPEPYSSYQSHYSASDPDARKNYPYGY